MTTILRKPSGDRATIPSIRVDVVEAGAVTRKGWLRCGIDSNVQFSTESMESYFFAQWEPIAYDALLVAAAAEFCDRTLHRPAREWGRDIKLRVPVHEPDRWNQKDVTETLHDTLTFLTGDRWQITFSARQRPQSTPRQGLIKFDCDVSAVIPFSDGLDSCAVAGLIARELGDRLVRVRLGSKKFDGMAISGHRQPFTAVPYKVRQGERKFIESSARARGFKFALVSGLAAYLAGANQVIVPESGQGSLGPALVPVGQAYVDYRSHPLFTDRMEKFFNALLGRQIQFEFPRLWHTKGESLAQFVNECDEGNASWTSTWSCWQQNRHVSVEKRKRQCGVCAACMLRRLSVHAAGLTEPSTTYVWEDLGASAFDAGAAATFDKEKITTALREHAIAGALHLDHLAALRRSALNASMLDLSAFQLSRCCDLSESESSARLDRLLTQHENEWSSFVCSLGPNSFVANWAICVQ